MRKKEMLKNLFGFNKNLVLINVPVRHGTLYGDKDKTELTNDFVTFDEIKSIFEAHKALTMIKAYHNMYDKVDEHEFGKKKYNNLFIGGPLANEKVADIFRQFFKGFKFGVFEDSKYLSQDNAAALSDLIFLDETKENREIQLFEGENNKVYFDTNDGYIILIKLSAKDYNDPEHGTIHICFGNNSNTSLNASKIYLEETKFLYEKLKNRDHYFVYIGCRNEKPFLDDFHDYTNIYFKE